MVWAWMLSSSYALGARTELWVGHGCSGSPYALGTRTGLWFWHECSGEHMHLEHEWNYGVSMDALVTLVSVCSWNTNGIMVLAWMF